MAEGYGIPTRIVAVALSFKNYGRLGDLGRPKWLNQARQIRNFRCFWNFPSSWLDRSLGDFLPILLENPFWTDLRSLAAETSRLSDVDVSFAISDRLGHFRGVDVASRRECTVGKRSAGPIPPVRPGSRRKSVESSDQQRSSSNLFSRQRVRALAVNFGGSGRPNFRPRDDFSLGNADLS